MKYNCHMRGMAWSLFLLTLALLLCWPGLQRGLSHDEACSLWNASLPLAEYARAETAPPLHPWLLRAWLWMFPGPAHIAGRLFSAACLWLTALLLPALVRAVFACHAKEWLGRCGSVLLLASPVAIAQAVNIRMYTLLLLVGLSSCIVWFGLRRGNGNAFFWLVLNAAGALTHYWFLFLIGAQCMAWLIAPPPGKRRWWLMTLGAVLSALPAMPFFLLQSRNRVMSYITEVDPWQAATAFTGFYSYFLPYANAVLAAFVLLLMLRLLPRVRHTPDPPELVALLVVLAFSVLVPVAVSRALTPVHVPGRGVLVSLPLLVVALLSLLRHFPSRRAVGGTVLLAVLALGNEHALARSGMFYSDRDTARLLQEHGARTVVFATFGGLATSYYAPTLTVVTFPAEQEAHPGWRDMAAYARQERKLRAEAEALCRRLRDEGEGVWLVVNANELPSRLLLRAAGKYFAAARTHDYSADNRRWHTHIIELRPTSFPPETRQ